VLESQRLRSEWRSAGDGAVSGKAQAAESRGRETESRGRLSPGAAESWGREAELRELRALRAAA